MSKKNKYGEEDFKFVSQFLEQDGITGHEYDISETFKNFALKHGAEVTRDGFGSVIAKVGNTGPKIMLAAHMDEVGFLVRDIEDEGMLRISNVGNTWMHTLLSTRVKVVNRHGKVFHGSVGSTAVHVLSAKDKEKVMAMKDVFVDIGFTSAKEVREAGIDIGDQIIRISDPVLMGDGDKYMAKAIDNRVGVAILAKMIENLKGQNINCQVYAVATAQEEFDSAGARGAMQMIQPDLTLTIDTTTAHDTPGIMKSITKLGKGVAFAAKDNAQIANSVLINQMVDLAKEKKIPAYKFVSMGGLNDSEVTKYSKFGIPVLTVSIPTRYLHTISEVGSLIDFRATADVLTEYAKKLDQKMVELMKY